MLDLFVGKHRVGLSQVHLIIPNQPPGDREYASKDENIIVHRPLSPREPHWGLEQGSRLTCR